MKIILFANTAWYLYNFRLPLALALRARGCQVILASPAEAPYGARLEQAGFESLVIPFQRRGVRPLVELATLGKIIALYRRLRPDVVHHFTVKPVLYGSIAAHLSGVKTIINAVPGLGYVFTAQGAQARLLRGLASALYRLALVNTQVIFQNPDDLGSFVQAGLVNPRQAWLIRGSGVDVDWFTPSEEPQGVPLVVLPARMLWDKGIAEFVEAAAMLRSGGVAARFALVGAPDAGNPSSVEVSQLERWKKQGLVEWWGWCEDMRAVYQAASIVCLPSYREGAPKTLIEAAACGRAVVTSDAPGCREVVQHGYNGLLTPLKDSAALADNLRSLITDAELRRQMGANGRRRAVAEFSLERVLAETLSVYNGTITGLQAGQR